MHARQRGVCWLLLLVLLGRVLDALDLPFEDGVAPTTPATPPTETPLHAPDVAAAPAPAAAETAPAPDTPLAINHADARQLQALPGVGPVLAARIVAYREQHGAFTNAQDLRGVQGIGARLVERLAPLLRFD